MPLFALICMDRPGGLETRVANRDAHLSYLYETSVVSQAGPFLNYEGEMKGSLIILDVADLTAAEMWAAKDPYARAGLFSSVRIEEWKKVI
jgi:uncharacterized protein YciI